MAASLELRVSTGSQDKERNTSRVLVELYINTNGGTYNQSGDTSGYIAVDGIQIEDLRGRAVYKDTETQLYSGEYEVRHNEDGTKTITVTAAFDVNTNTRWVYAEQRLTLETIKRASVLTIPALTMGEETELTVKKYVESYTHTLEYRFKDLTEKIVEKTGETVLRWTPPLAAFAERVPDKTADSGTMTLITYNENGVEIGRHESAFTAKVPEDVVPSIMRLTVTPVSSNAAADGWGVAVQNKSRMRYKIEAQSMYGATISEYAFSFSGQTLTEKEGETALLNKSGSFEPMATVKDTRGRSAEIKMAEVQVYEYSLPTLSGSYAYRSDGNGNKGDGEYVTAYGKASCSSVGGRNGVTLRIRSRTSGGEWKDDYAAMTSGIERRFSGFEKDKTYEVEIYAVDTIGEQTSVPYIVETERVAFHLKGDTEGGAAFGKYAEKTGVLECAWEAQFDKNVKVEGTVTAADVVVGGKTLLDLLHPIGSYYISDDAAEPSVLFGGVWVKIEGRFLLGSGSGYNVGDPDGGEEKHALTLAEMPNHDHTYGEKAYAVKEFTSRWGGANGNTGAFVNASQELFARGNNEPHNNMPPYHITNVWRRTA